MGRLMPPDPRKALPSRADPHERSRRKELEKKHPFSLKEPLILGLIGVGLIWNIENQVEKAERRKEQEEQEEDARRRRRGRGLWEDRGREDGDRAGRSSQSRRRRYPEDADESRAGDRRDGRSRDWYRGGDWDREGERERDLGAGRMGRIGYERPREYTGYRDQFQDLRSDERYEARRDGSTRRSSRRDSF